MFFSSWGRILCFCIVFLALGFSFIIKPTITGHFEGLYLLKNGPYSYQIKDDYFLGDEARMVYAVRFSSIINLFKIPVKHPVGESYLEVNWQSRDGSGFIINHLPDGSKLLTCFSRFMDSNGKETYGLFVGGGLPAGVDSNNNLIMNETGMSFYDGKEWKHVWCNVNEGIVPVNESRNSIPPSAWKFLDSRILKKSDKELVLQSRHEVLLGGKPLLINRYAFFKAGERFFTLVIKIINNSDSQNVYGYMYGDEPWLGDFGTSRGNVGWSADRLYNYEGTVDTAKYSHAGMYDFGNKLLPDENRTFSGLANFIDWHNGIKPELVVFSNSINKFAPEKEKVPLSSQDNRIIMVQWGPRILYPRQVDTIVLGIGMADNSSSTGFPLLPASSWSMKDMNPFIEEEK